MGARYVWVMAQKPKIDVEYIKKILLRFENAYEVFRQMD
jgi:hypothetical protein